MGSTIFEALSSYIRNIDSKYNDFVEVVRNDFLGGVGTNDREFDIFNVSEVIWSNNNTIATITYGGEYSNEGEYYPIQNTHNFKEFTRTDLRKVCDAVLSDIMRFKNNILFNDIAIRIDQIIIPKIENRYPFISDYKKHLKLKILAYYRDMAVFSPLSFNTQYPNLISKLYDLLIYHKFIAGDKLNFMNGFTGKEVYSGISWIHKVKDKTNKVSLVYLLKQLVDNNIINGVNDTFENKKARYVFRENNGIEFIADTFNTAKSDAIKSFKNINPKERHYNAYNPDWLPIINRIISEIKDPEVQP